MKYKITINPVGTYDAYSEKLDYQLIFVNLKQCRWFIGKVVELINSEDFKSFNKIIQNKRNGKQKEN